MFTALCCVLCGQKDSIFISYFLFTVGSVCRVKRFHLGCKYFADDEQTVSEVRKWLRQQPKDFYAAGFGALVKHGTSVSVLVEDMPKNECFSPFRISRFPVFKHPVALLYPKLFFFSCSSITYFTFICICGLFTGSPAYGVLHRQHVA
jgi:cellulose synthase/poly-beta-1,6-N-acetylglucosamine synthase-like glycosyltransferase